MPAITSSDFDPYHKWLGIPSREQPPHHYRLLGLDTFESDPEVIENAADARIRHIRSFQTGERARQSQQLLNEIAVARHCLLNGEQKAKYDSTLRLQLQSRWKNPPRKPPCQKKMPPRIAAQNRAEIPPALVSAGPSPLERRKRASRLENVIPLAIGSGVLAVILLVGFTALLATKAGPVASQPPAQESPFDSSHHFGETDAQPVEKDPLPQSVDFRSAPANRKLMPEAESVVDQQLKRFGSPAENKMLGLLFQPEKT